MIPASIPKKYGPHPEDTEYKIDADTLRLMSPLPQGPPGKNDSLARPNVLMFGDFMWIGNRTDSQSQRFHCFLESLHGTNCSLVIVEIGAGEYVPTVRFQSESLTERYKNSTLIRINPRDWQIPRKGVDISLPIGGLQVLQLIDEELDK